MSQRIIQYLDRAISILSSTQHNLDKGKTGELLGQLKDLREKWSEASQVVGLMGVTSSGKSTLINALLGEKLLVSRIKPSSNTVVECRKGKEIALQIEFKGGKTKAFSIKKAGQVAEIKKIIAQYTDESQNQDNKKNVELLRLTTPGFRLGDNLIVADTPGLNAYGLKAHEDLTWEFFVPSVDMAILLTTAKANSDAQISKYLERLKGYNKPVLLVQNMKDSVNPELGDGGKVLKTTEEVLAIHKKRLERIRDKIFVNTPHPPVIVQVSAAQALSPDQYEKSGFPEMIRIIQSELGRLTPTMEAGRLSRLRDRLTPLIDSVRTAQKAGKVTWGDLDQADLTNLEGRLKNMETNYETQRRSINSQLDSVISAMKGFIQQSGSVRARPRSLCEHWEHIDAMSTSDTYTVGNDSIRVFDDALIQMTDLIKTISAEASSIAQRLKLEESEFRRKAWSANIKKSRIDIKMEEKTPVRVKKDGVISWFARKLPFGDYGYKYVNGKSYVFDIEAFKRDLLARIDENSREFYSACRGSDNTIGTWSDRLREQIKKERRILAEAEELRQQLASSRDAVERLIQDIDDEIAKKPVQARSTTSGTQGQSDSELETFQVLRPALLMAKLADMVSAQAHLATRNCFLKSGSHALLIGWDAASIEQFLRLFWFDYDLSSLDLRTLETPIDRSHRFPLVSFKAPTPKLPMLHVVLANAPGIHADGGRFLKKLIGRVTPFTPFTPSGIKPPPPLAGLIIMVDGIQTGDTQSQFQKSKHWLEPLTRQIKGDIWACLQSGRAYYNNVGKFNPCDFLESLEAIVDTFAEFSMGERLSAVLVNDRDIGLSAIANYMAGKSKISQNEAKKMAPQFYDILDTETVISVFQESLKKSRRGY